MNSMKDKFLDGNSIEDIFNGIKEGNISGRDIKVWTKPFSHGRPHLTTFDLHFTQGHENFRNGLSKNGKTLTS